MKSYLPILLLTVVCSAKADTNELVVIPEQGDVSSFTDSPHFSLARLWGDGNSRIRGARNIVVAQDGSVLAFHQDRLKRSRDGGQTWSNRLKIDERAIKYNAVIDESTGTIQLINPTGYRLISTDAGMTWTYEEITVMPNLFGHGSSETSSLSVHAMQPGVTLRFGQFSGRLLMPARYMLSNELISRPYNYNTAMYSDDQGKTWQTTSPFPVLGTGEAALAEVSDGRILYSSREHMSIGNRFFAWSHDGGERWLNFWRSEVLPDGPRGSSYGCMGGLVRLPVAGRDILIYSNLDTERGEAPPVDRAGKTSSGGRENITVWVSFDGGASWPIKRLVFDGPSAYSCLAVGRPGTPSGGKIYLYFEGDTAHKHAGIQISIFNLSWVLDGERTGDGSIPAWVHQQ